MLHTILLIILGLVLFGVLTAIFETVGLKKHPYVARTLAAISIMVAAYINCGYRSWRDVLIVIVFGFGYLEMFRELRRQLEKHPE